MDTEPLLRPHRKDLVLAAESTVHETKLLPRKAQLNRLVSICGEATCAEEIANYLRYQASRDAWSELFANTVIAKIQPPLEVLIGTLRDPAIDRDQVRVAAWRLYAVFLVRAATYAEFVRKKGNGHDRPRR